MQLSIGNLNRVKKPWGYEFRADLSPSLTLTYLSISPGEQTSLHCHPRKTTSLTAISGVGVIRFLKDSIEFSSGTSFMVRNGLFHQISNKGTDNLVVLEFENPSDPMDLVRLEDEYGRVQESYEKNSESILLSDSEANFFHLISNGGTWSNHETVINVLNIENNEISLTIEAVYAVLEGGLRDRVSKALILREGDCTTTPTIQRLVSSFEWDSNTRLLQIVRKIP